MIASCWATTGAAHEYAHQEFSAFWPTASWRPQSPASTLL